MGWDENRYIEPEVAAGRVIIGAAVRRARLRHGLSQRQLGSYVLLDQTTISKLENAKLKGIRFSRLCRVVGMVSRAGAFELPEATTRSPRRLPGEAEANAPMPGPALGAPSYDADGHGSEDLDDDGEFGSYEAELAAHEGG